MGPATVRSARFLSATVIAPAPHSCGQSPILPPRGQMSLPKTSPILPRFQSGGCAADSRSAAPIPLGQQNRCPRRTLVCAQAEEQLLCMLRQKSRTRLQKLCLPQRAALYRYRRPNRIAITLRAPQSGSRARRQSARSVFRRIRICGAFRLLSTISSRPSWSRSASAKVRQSWGKSSPAGPEISANVPSPLFTNITFRA